MVSPYYNGVEWPPHVHREFPKYVKRAVGEPVLVQNADEEAAILDAEPASAKAPVVDVAALMAQMAALQAKLDAMEMAPKSEADERAELMAEAETRGIAVDKRWGIERLRAALA